MGHTQTITQVRTDNTISSGIANDTMKQRRSHTMNMCYFWTREQKSLKNSLVAWKAGQENMQTILQNIIL